MLENVSVDIYGTVDTKKDIEEILRVVYFSIPEDKRPLIPDSLELFKKFVVERNSGKMKSLDLRDSRRN